MKQVFNTNEVAHIWANQQQDKGRNWGGNFYFEGQTIYSYGRHFPIATIVGNDVLFTLRSYSNTTAKHISKTRGAVSHKNLIWCYDVPVSYKKDAAIKDLNFLSTHENNFNYWKGQIKAKFAELGNKKIRDTESWINSIQYNISQLKAYCRYFGISVKDKELKQLIKLAEADNFIELAREAKAKENAANEKKMKQAAKAFEQYIILWREYKDDEIRELPEKTKELVRYYDSNQQAFTRLRFNAAQNRLETSKGIQIPAEVAKRAFTQLNGCMEGTCNSIAVPVMNYTITETTKDYIKAGCHTIPKSDVWYIANLLNW